MTIAATPAPTADWVTLPELHDNPFAAYRRLRAESPVAWVPSVGRYLVTTFAECHRIEKDQETFTADEDGSLMKRAMGHSMLRKDDPDHQREREAFGNLLRPNAIKETWASIFERNADRLIAELTDRAPENGTYHADLHTEFAAPYAAENLRVIMGFHCATQQDLQRWSQTMIDGTGNYADDPEIWALAEQSSREVDAAIDEMLPYLRVNPDASLLSHLANSGALDVESIRANMKMTIGGGLNEPRDVLGTAVWALLDNPVQLAQVLADPKLFGAVFDESVRWVAPIGMYPRQTTRVVELAGAVLPAGARLGVVLGSANRDERQFTDPDTFDINRAKKPHLAFGGGVHYCAGAWVARSSIAQVALPKLFARLPRLRLSAQRPVRAAGWVFRGMLSLPVTWN
ncbi:cytochrome P450 [Nocardia beijingensis]